MRLTRRQGALPILVARFSYYCMDIGLAKSFGVLVPDLEEQLHTSSAIVGLVTSLSLAFMYLGSPFAKIVLHHCAHRRLLTSLSGLVAGCALIGTAFTRNVVGLSFLFLIMGLCCSVVNLQAIVLLFEYYQEDYPFASCVTVLAIPLGAAILPPVTETFLDLYGVSGCLLLLGALTLNMLPIGLALKERLVEKPNKGPAIAHTSEVCFAGPVTNLDSSPSRQNTEITRQSNRVTGGRDLSFENKNVQTEDMDDVGSCKEKNANESSATEPHRSHKDVSQEATIEYQVTYSNKLQPSKSSLPEEVPVHASSSDSVEKGYLQNKGLSGTFESNTDDGVKTPSSRRVKTCLARCHLDVLLDEPLFTLVYLPATVLLFLVTGGWALFVVLYAVEHDIDLARAAYLPTCGAIGGIISSILISAVTWYRPKWSPYLLFASLTLSGACFFLQTLESSYIYLLVMSFFIGCGLYSSNVISEAVMARTVLAKNFSNASSPFLFAVGFGYLISGYIAGFVRDETGDIKCVYLFLGATTVVALLFLVILLICLQRRVSSHT